MRELEQEFGNELVVIGVHSAKFPAERADANLRKAVLRLGVDHPVVNDGDFAIWQAYTVRAWPTLMFIDPRGSVIGKHEGEFELAGMRAFLRDAIDAFDAEGGIDRRSISREPEAEVTNVLRFPGKVLADAHGERLFIADSGNHRIVMTDLAGQVRRVFGSGSAGHANGPVATASFSHPQGLAIDRSGSLLFVADTGNHLLRAVDLHAGVVSTVAGTGQRAHELDGGPGKETALASPWDLAWVDDRLWIAMAGTHQLWAFDPASGDARPVAGSGHESIHDGPLLSATFAQPSGLCTLDGAVYVADSETSAIRLVAPAADRVRRLVGRGLFEFGDVDAKGDSVRLQHPLAVATTFEDGEPAVYLADSYNHKIKRLLPGTRTVTTEFGSGEAGHVDGDGDVCQFWEPGGLSLLGHRLYVADTNNHAIRVADLEAKTVHTVKIEGL